MTKQIRRKLEERCRETPDSSLPIGTKNGCLTIIDRFEDRFDNCEGLDLDTLQEKQKKWLEGTNKRYDAYTQSAEKMNHWISDSRKARLCRCQCECGRILFLPQDVFISFKGRFCTRAVTKKDLDSKISGGLHFGRTEDDVLSDYYGLAVRAWKKKQQNYKEHGIREFAENYDLDFSGRTFESLEVLDLIDDDYEERHQRGDLRRKDAYVYTVYKRYRCRCYLCGKEHIIKCSQFIVNPPTYYGETAYHGYWSEVRCDCHPISSFQWKVNKLLFENQIKYRVEYSFSDLLGMYKVNPLRFDFAVFDDNGTISCLIECQGEQHYMPVNEFGGEIQYSIQTNNDQLKRAYATEHNIKLIEISYKDKDYDRIEEILKDEGII